MARFEMVPEKPKWPDPSVPIERELYEAASSALRAVSLLNKGVKTPLSDQLNKAISRYEAREFANSTRAFG